jgi:nucleoid-associated protein YgaU
MSDKALQKASIVAAELSQTLICRFNPKEYTVSTSASWAKTPAKGAEKAPKPEFVGTNPRSLQMELFLDSWDSKTESVSKDVEMLMNWTTPTPKSLQANKPNPPIVAFHWGATTLFDAFLKSVSARFTLFRANGEPLRAVVSVGFEEVPNDAAKQNPTSGGIAGRRARLVGAGDSLQSIAYDEYGDPTRWRLVAEANGIDDPFNVAIGARLLIPPH